MTVYRRKTNDGKFRWHYRVKIRLPDGARPRISGTPSLNTRAAAVAAERAHIDRVVNPRPEHAKRPPTVAAFFEHYMTTHVAANNKQSTRIAKDSMFKVHILPVFGGKRLDEITTASVEAFKADRLAGSEKPKRRKVSPKTVNNLLTALGKLLRYAAECEILDKLPRIRFVKVLASPFDFLDYDEYERVVEAARMDETTRAAVLLGGDAGLRLGEIRALQWGDLDLKAGRVLVQRTDYRGHLGSPKGGRIRRVPMTTRLKEALKAIRHLKGEWVFSDKKGERWTRCEADTLLRKARARAGLRKIGWHALRHTFCSHLAMRGAPVRTIQELAGHASITTTMRYMHLTETAVEDAIRLLGGSPRQTLAADTSSR